jgi:hypothetical protein
MGDLTSPNWPHHRQLAEGLHLIALNPCKPNVLGDRGCLGPGQLNAVHRLLNDIPPADRLLILCHYTLGAPPGYPPEKPGHSMIDAPELTTLLREAGHSTLFLHGHVHRPWCWRPPQVPNVIAVNAGAPILTGHGYPAGQGFWSIDVSLDSTLRTPHSAFPNSAPFFRLTHHIPTPEGMWRDIDITLPTDTNAPARVD